MGICKESLTAAGDVGYSRRLFRDDWFAYVKEAKHQDLRTEGDLYFFIEVPNWELYI